MMDRYGHLFPEADSALAARLEEMATAAVAARTEATISELRS